MFRAEPKSEISRFINSYKSAGSRLLKKEYPQIREKLWKEAFWSQSFCLISAGGAPIDIIRMYIESQGEKSERCIQVSRLSQWGTENNDRENHRMLPLCLSSYACRQDCLLRRAESLGWRVLCCWGISVSLRWCICWSPFLWQRRFSCQQIQR